MSFQLKVAYLSLAEALRIGDVVGPDEQPLFTGGGLSQAIPWRLNAA